MRHTAAIARPPVDTHHGDERDADEHCRRSGLWTGWHPVDVMLLPQPVNRVANAMPGAALAALGIATLLHGTGLGKAGGVGIPLGILLAFRGFRMGAETRSGSVIIWGMLRTRVIPRNAIAEITDFPAVVWTNPVGNRRWSPLLAFQTPSRALTGIAEHHVACVQRLRKWARHR